MSLTFTTTTSSIVLDMSNVGHSIRTILECVGEDPDREGLRLTPERYAKAMLYFTKGYEQNIRDIVGGAIFQEDHDEMGMQLIP